MKVHLLEAVFMKHFDFSQEKKHRCELYNEWRLDSVMLLQFQGPGLVHAGSLSCN